MNITRYSIDRPVFLGVFLILIFSLGILSFLKLRYELVPDFNPPVLTVVTILPGASPEEVEKKVSIVLEDALSSLPDIELITTTSRENFSLIRMETKSGSDIEAVLNEANRKIVAAIRNLPKDVEYPILSRFDFDDLPIISLGIFADLTPDRISRIAVDQIIPTLSRVKGVAEVKIIGEQQKQINIEVSPNRLERTNSTILQVLQAVGSNNIQIPIGGLSDESASNQVVLDGQIENLDQLGDLTIYKNEQFGIFTQIKDIARIGIGYRDPESISRLNGLPSLSLEIKKQSNANAVEVSQLVMSKLIELEERYSNESLRFEIAQDSSEFTLKAAYGVMEDLAIAVLLVSLVMIVFLHSFRNAMIVFVSIPTSIISTFIVMYLLGYSLNLLTLLGLSLAIGILVDDSIVVIENIHRHLLMKKPARKAAYEGRMEIGFAAISITLIDVVVFLPIVFTEGMVSSLLREFSVVIVCSTLMSLLISFTLVPYLASRIHRSFKIKSVSNGFFYYTDKALEYLSIQVQKILVWSFRHRVAAFSITLILLVGSIWLIPAGFIGVEFTKAGDRSEFLIELKLRPGTTLEKTDKITEEAEAILLSYPEVKTVFTSVGTTSSGRITTNTSNLAEIRVNLVEKEKRDFLTRDFSRHIRYRLMTEIAGLEAIPFEINIIGLRDDDAVQVTIQGENDSLVATTATEIFNILKDVEAVIEPNSNSESEIEIIEIIPGRKRMEQLGINIARSGIALRTAINGNSDFEIEMDGETFPIAISLNKGSKTALSDLRNLTFINDKGRAIPLYQFADLKITKVSSQLERTNRGRSSTLKAQVFGKPAGSASADFKNQVEELTLPKGINLIYGGATKRTEDGLKSMAGAFVISVLLVYLILSSLYNSFYYPLVVLFCIPFAIIGAFTALAVTGEALSIFSIMGLIILVGLVGKNAILVVDFTNTLRQQGKNRLHALLQATRLRFRPILMTNLTMVIGLLPIAYSTGAGSEWKNGLAWALIGGLSSSMILSLILVPLVYELLDNLLVRKKESGS